MTAWLPTLHDADDPELRAAAPLGSVAAIVGFGALLRVLTFRGFIGSDDRAYADLAHALASGAYPVFDAYTPVFQNRIGRLFLHAHELRFRLAGETAERRYRAPLEPALEALAASTEPGARETVAWVRSLFNQYVKTVENGPGFDSMWTDMSEIVRPTGSSRVNTIASTATRRTCWTRWISSNA